MCDGFDYGNKRNYFENAITFNAKTNAGEDNNTLGLYEILDGSPSPWNTNDKHPHLVDSLLKYGYDLIFVNSEIKVINKDPLIKLNKVQLQKIKILTI